MPCPVTPYPRSALSGFGSIVAEMRKTKRWSQIQLAAKAGVSRSAIARLERCTSMPSMPGMPLVRALIHHEVLGDILPVGTSWEIPVSGSGPLAQAARYAARKSLRAVADACGVSTASLSLFERQILAAPRKLDPDGAGIRSDAYAHALGFADAADMNDYLDADDPQPWLIRIARSKGLKVPPPSRLPAKRVVNLNDDRPVIDD